MFEAAQEQKQAGSNKMVVGAFVVIAAVAVGGVLYTLTKNSGQPSAPKTAAAGAPVPAGKADAEHDLKILSSRMEKDRLGTTAVWLVDIDNKSKTYTYSSIQYETTYVGPNNAALVVNKGTIPVQLGPARRKTRRSATCCIRRGRPGTSLELSARRRPCSRLSHGCGRGKRRTFDTGSAGGG
jgi:hypothetical protein